MTGIRHILRELKSHAPFTALGASSGVLLVFGLSAAGAPHAVSEAFFWTLHPAHVFLSALVTTAMFKLHTCPKAGFKSPRGECNWWALVAIGYFGSVGIATLSDCLIPYVAEFLLDMPRRGAHLGFIDMWWLVNPLALLGIAVGFAWPRTHFPHLGHVFISTWASAAHVAMASGAPLTWIAALVVVVFLFVSVWVPCCASDIVFPLLFAGGKEEEKRACQN